MSWISLNSFSFVLTGVTVFGAAGLLYYGKQGGERYQKAKSDFDQALEEVRSIEKSVPYPSPANSNGKKKAIEEFKKDVESLQEAYAPYRVGELKMVSPEQFIDRLKEVNKETRDEFERNAVAVPELYFAGFKDYTSKFPNKSATGILGYQLEAIRELQIALAKSGTSELRNLHRPALDEENGLVFKAPADMVARPLPLEITFRAPERAVRNFLSALAKSDKYYWVIRSLRIGNMKKEPPKTADAKFATPAARAAGGNEAFRFDSIFEEANPAPGAAPAAPGAPPAAPGAAPAAPGAAPAAPGAAPAAPGAAPAVPGAAPAAPGAASPEGNRILALILGNEELLVHLRLDLMLIPDPKPLP